MTDSVDKELEAYHQTKEYKDFSNEMGRKMYFCTQYRNRTRRDFTKLQNDSLKSIEKLESLRLSSGNDIQLAETRLLWEKILDMAGMYVDWCDRADKMAEERKSTRRKFMLYKSKKANRTLFKLKFFIPAEKKYHLGYYMIFGQLSYKKQKCRWYGPKYSYKGYELIDSGTYGKRQRDFKDVLLTFKGKKTIKVHFTPRGDSRYGLWAQVVNKEE